MTQQNYSHNSPIWHPFTQMKTAQPPLKVVRGKGVWLELENGQKILDAISSWWVNIHGHAHPLLAETLYQQAQELEQVIFAGFTHEPAEKFAHKLLCYLPNSLKRIFFSDNGSTAVEVALKMAYQYWQNQGESQRTRFLGFEGGYHGDTIGAMSIGKSSTWWQPFDSLLFTTDIVPFPSTFEGDTEVETKEHQALEKIRHYLNHYPQQYAAIFIEPLVQGAGGMRMCRSIFLQKLQQLAQKYNLLLIYDEVMTGFGRTGELFACLTSQTSPDLLCLSKGITGGYMPLAVTVCQEKIYQAFYKDENEKAFFHGHSYTGNPLACRLALTSLEMLLANPHYQTLETQHRNYFQQWLAHHPRIEKPRFCGTIAAMDIKTGTNSGYFNTISPLLKTRFLEAGFLLRPLGNTIYIMPPYCIKPDELASIYQAIYSIIDSL